MRQSVPSTRRTGGNTEAASSSVTVASAAADSDEDEERPLNRPSPDSAASAASPREASPRLMDGSGLSGIGSGSSNTGALLPLHVDSTHRTSSVSGARSSSGLRSCVDPAVTRFMAAPRWQRWLIVLSLLCVMVGAMAWWRARQEETLQLSVRAAEASLLSGSAAAAASSSNAGIAASPLPSPPPASLFPSVCSARHPLGLESMAAAVPSSGRRYFIALNLHNSEENGVLASLRVEMLRLISAIAWREEEAEAEGESSSEESAGASASASAHSASRRLLPHNVFVSIYESGSSDGTVSGLRSLAADLRGFGVPHRIVVQGALRKGEHRIESLAAMRNAAMQPLYDAGRAIAEGRGEDDPNAVTYDRILFVNDVLFCAEDLLRLLTPQQQQQQQQQQATEVEEQSLKPSQNAAGSDRASALSSPSPSRPPLARSGLPDMLCAMDFEYENVRVTPPGGALGFYDYWVMRDRGGQQLAGRFPLRFKDSRDQNAWEEGRRIDVQCCWGGAVSLAASLFQTAGLSIRSRTEACASSECSSVCSDIIGLRGESAWIQIDSLAATTYRREGHQALNELDWFNVAQRAQTRDARDKARAVAPKRCAAEMHPHPHPHAPMEGEEQAETASASDIASCPPAAPLYPAALYLDRPLAYPPPTHCCSEYRESRHYWLHCAAVQTILYSDEQRERIREADHDFMLDLWDAEFDPK